MAMSHGDLIKYMQRFGYRSNKLGVCFGVIVMGVQAILTHELKKFDNRLKLMKEDLASNYQLLSMRERYQHEIIPFIEGIELYLQAQLYMDLFEKGKNPYQNPSQIAPLVNSIKMEKEGGLAECASFSGVYNKKELIEYFGLLRESVESADPLYNEPATFILRNINHAISVSYDPIEKEWIYIDANKLALRRIYNETAIAEAVMKAFFASDFALRSNLSPGDPFAPGTLYIYLDTDDNNHAIYKYIGLDPKDFTKTVTGTLSNIPFPPFKLTEESLIPLKEKLLLETAGKGHSYSSTPVVIFSTEAYSTNKNKQAFTAILNQLVHNGAWKEIHNPFKKNITFTDIWGSSWLFIASREGHINELDQLSEYDAININQTLAGTTPLNLASQNGHFTTVKHLLAKGAAPDFVSQDGITALYKAAQNGHSAIVKLLLAKGANPNLVNENKISPLYMAAQNGHSTIVKLLLAKGANPHLVGQNKITPLYIAAQMDEVSCVKQLLAHGADPNNDAAPLVAAAGNGHANIIKLLLKHKNIDINRYNPFSGHTALYAAAKNGHFTVTEQLLSKGADPNKKVGGLSPLSTALENNHLEIIEQLLNHKDIDSNEVKANLPQLHTLAAKHNHKAILKRLLDFGLAPNKNKRAINYQFEASAKRARTNKASNDNVANDTNNRPRVKRKRCSWACC